MAMASSRDTLKREAAELRRTITAKTVLSRGRAAVEVGNNPLGPGGIATRQLEHEYGGVAGAAPAELSQYESLRDGAPFERASEGARTRHDVFPAHIVHLKAGEDSERESYGGDLHGESCAGLERQEAAAMAVVEVVEMKKGHYVDGTLRHIFLHDTSRDQGTDDADPALLKSERMQR